MPVSAALSGMHICVHICDRGATFYGVVHLRAQHKKAFYECLASLPPANAPEDARRLDDLLYCLPYARAAYGFAMYMGYLETPLQCALLPVDAVTQGFDARVADARSARLDCRRACSGTQVRAMLAILRERRRRCRGCRRRAAWGLRL